MHVTMRMLLHGLQGPLGPVLLPFTHSTPAPLSRLASGTPNPLFLQGLCALGSSIHSFLVFITESSSFSPWTFMFGNYFFAYLSYQTIKSMGPSITCHTTIHPSLTGCQAQSWCCWHRLPVVHQSRFSFPG